MKAIPTAAARERVQKFRKKFKTHKEAAEAAGCTEAQMSHALSGRAPICPSIQRAVGICRATLYVDVASIPDGFTHS